MAGLAGTTGEVDGAGSSARFSGPQGLAVNGAGVVFIADTFNGTIRQMNTLDVVTTVAGSASANSANGMTTTSRFYAPQNVASDTSGNLFVADTQNSVLRMITPAGVVSTLAGTPGVFGSAEGSGPTVMFSSPQGVAVDNNGNIYVADTGNNTIRKITSGGSSSTLAGAAGNPGNQDGSGTNAQFYHPEGLAVDGGGNVYVADSWNHTIRKITSGGTSSTLAGLAGTFGTFDGAGSAARFNNPAGVAVDGNGNVYVTDYNNNTIREVTSAGVVTTIAGWAGIWGSADGTGTNALFLQPTGISVDGLGNLYIIDSGNSTLRKLTPNGTNWSSGTVAGSVGVSGQSNGLGTAALFNYPTGVSVNSAGYLFVADTGNNAIRTSKGLAAISWANPAPIVYGTALGGGQLNASSGTGGAFTYTPSSGAVLNTGTNTLSVTLTPSDTTDFAGASASVSLAVTPATLTVTANSTNRPFGAANPVFTGVISGLQNSDNITANYTTTAVTNSPAGPYPIIPSLMDPGNRETNYFVNLNDGVLTVSASSAPGVFNSIAAEPNGTILFNVSGTANANYTLDVSTDLVHWSPLTNFVMTNGAVQLLDAASTNYPARFYILAAP